MCHIFFILQDTAWTSTSDPHSKPAHKFLLPVKFSTSDFNTVKIDLPIIRCNTLPTPIGLTPGDLFKGTNRLANIPSMFFGSPNSSEHSIRANNTQAWQRLSDALPKVELYKILIQKLVPSLEGPCDPVVLIAHFLTKSLFTPPNISFTWLKGPWNIMVSFDSFYNVSWNRQSSTAIIIQKSNCCVYLSSKNKFSKYFRFCFWFLLLRKPFFGSLLFHPKDLHCYFPKGWTSLQHGILFPTFYTYLKLFVILEMA